ncbi:uncharacterized protein Z518_09041 [Rhinocladiella mackenziei CBS 650.93]|uniref:GRF-type domain-containing protein n=1 Tax=Rhinocladiella mackenziei CBS 650.93 TaxID=1442369 RepID=A0A0D2IDK3_9EURO|nr:uncharacterized protein Z518_09041 [Rhinocladiella mackenziei CBS 650.93]KIX01316.1 hypothetical protein Z518_09041 [Rhinocladiella mackenziei CBS 650.93]
MTPYKTRNGRTSKRGAFIEGVWHCDCEPRLPADKFQTKNGGKNHGRWFYTCQKPQHKRCSFFLWSDDAKFREEAAVLSNSRSEPPGPPQTPGKARSNIVPPTPETRPRNDKQATEKYPKDGGHPEKLKHKESFEWSSSNDEALLKAEQELLLDRTTFETPNKAPRTASLTSPGKRTLGQMSERPSAVGETWPLSDDVFATPSTSHKSTGTNLLSPTHTPSRGPPQATRSEPEPSSLASEALAILRGVNLSSHIESDLVDLLNKYDLRTQGIIKGRDITRLAVQAKEEKIAELQARISALEAEKDTNRRVITHLKHDMATSPKKGKGRITTPARRSET